MLDVLDRMSDELQSVGLGEYELCKLIGALKWTSASSEEELREYIAEVLETYGIKLRPELIEKVCNIIVRYLRMMNNKQRLGGDERAI